MTNGRWLMVAAIGLAAGAAAQPTAEYRTAGAIARARAVDGQVRSIIALDPTAIDQARAIDRRRAAGALAGTPVRDGNGRVAVGVALDVPFEAERDQRRRLDDELAGRHGLRGLRRCRCAAA